MINIPVKETVDPQTTSVKEMRRMEQERDESTKIGFIDYRTDFNFLEDKENKIIGYQPYLRKKSPDDSRRNQIC